MLKRLFGSGSEELARLSIPGEVTVELPAGRVKLRYEQARESVQRNAFRPPEIEPRVTPAEGGPPLELKRPRMVTGSSGKVSAAPLGSVEVPASGSYRITVSEPVDRPQATLVLLS